MDLKEWKQLVFDKVAKHLLKQGKRVYNGVTCCYRNQAGLKCAVGCLIDDDRYDPEIEGLRASAERVLRAIPEMDDSCLLPQNLRVMFLEQLQKIHDTQHETRWRDELSFVAREHGLDESALR